MLKHTLIPSVVMTVCALLPTSHAETLNSADRESLTEQLDFIINKGKEAMTKRQATAYRAYKSAMSSESSALDFYLDCVEKVDFIDNGKKSSDFRSWKTKQKEKLSEPGFRCALRHQLNWLVLTIDAARLAQEEESLYILAPAAKAAIDNIYDDAKKLDGFHDTLQKDVVGTVFAKAYGFGTYRVKDWPTTPLNIADVYEKVVFPAFREEKKPDSLRTAWKQRIMYQELMLEYWSKAPESKRVGMKRDMKPPAYYKFIEKEKPNLQWEMEVDVFNAGDELGSAGRMLSHIKANIDHNNALKWVKQLHELVAPEDAPLVEETATTPAQETTSTYIELSE